MSDESEKTHVDFKTAAKEFCLLNKQIKQVSEDVKKVKKRQNELKEWILDYMESEGWDTCLVRELNVKFTKQQRNTKKKPSQKEMREKWIEFFGGNKAQAESLYKATFEDVPRRQTRSLYTKFREVEQVGETRDVTLEDY